MVGTFKLRKLADYNWIADLYDEHGRLEFTTTNHYCAYQAAFGATQGGQRQRTFTGATTLLGGVTVPVNPEPCNYNARYGSAHYQDLHTHTHRLGAELLTVGLPHVWAARPGESFLDAKRRIDNVGREVLPLLPAWSEAVVDNRDRAIAIDTADDVVIGPMVCVALDDGSTAWVAACRVSPVSHRSTLSFAAPAKR